MKKIYQAILMTVSIMALASCGTLGGGDTDVSNNADFKSYKGICAKVAYFYPLYNPFRCRNGGCQLWHCVCREGSR